jgi:hypothetical protein
LTGNFRINPLSASLTEDSFLPVEIIKGQRLIHDTGRVRTVFQAKEVADLVTPFLHNPLDKLVFVVRNAIEPIIQPDCGNNRYAGQRTSKTEKGGHPFGKQIIPADEEHWARYSLPLSEELKAIQYGTSISLSSRSNVAVKDNWVCTDKDRKREKVTDEPGDRKFESSRSAGIPKNKEIHYYYIHNGRS